MQNESFFETFGIREGDKMYMAPEDRIAIWE
jgi:putative endopeptidase